ncbi:MAG TPA: c-type cytochrome [Polyangiaceae bacterium]
MRHAGLLAASASVLALAAAAACSTSSSGGAPAGDVPDASGDDAAVEPAPIFIAGDPQRSGDAAKGYEALVDQGYVGCGIPTTAYAQVFGAPQASQLIPGRNATNAQIPYNLTRFTTPDGVDVVGPNCLSCHAATLGGQVVVGLGDTSQDFTVDFASQAALAQALLTDPREKAELTKFVGRGQALGPYTQPLTVGVTPADDIAAVLFAHEDVSTLAWSDTPILPLPPAYAVPVDVPPWWRMSKKNAMFYTAAGRGDHARIMMTASTFCVDSVAQAQAIDAYFPDVRAYVESLAPPKYPLPVDAALAAKGQGVFATTCARCHGTYGDGASYPNLVIPLADVGTDATIAAGTTQFAGVYVDWFNHSFYGQIAHLDSQQGYYAPPLDGIWATAPYFHNGSVPAIEAVLDSAARPTYFVRSTTPADYDAASLGWKFTPQPTGQDAEPDPTKRKLIYDTTKAGYSNAGHTYGDALSPDDRAAVIEYLKTL